MVHVHDFLSYFYVEQPVEMQSTEENFELVRKYLCQIGKAQRSIGQRV